MTCDCTISLGQIIQSSIGLLGLVGLFFAYQQLRLVRANSAENSKATKARFVLDLNKWFNDDDKERAFFYRLDYTEDDRTFRFDPDRFRHSEDERHLDSLLYKLNHVGTLLRLGLLTREDLGSISFIATQTLKNKDVLKYLEWLKSTDQVPTHVAFTDAVSLFGKLHGHGHEAWPRLVKYLDRPITDSGNRRAH